MSILAQHAVWLTTSVATLYLPVVLPAVMPRKSPVEPKRRDQFKGGHAPRLTRAHRRGFVEAVVVRPPSVVRHMHSSARRRLTARLSQLVVEAA